MIFYHNLLHKNVQATVWKFKPLEPYSSCSLDKLKLHNYHMIKLNILARGTDKKKLYFHDTPIEMLVRKANFFLGGILPCFHMTILTILEFPR